MIHPLRYLWAAPNTLLGLMFLPFALRGGRIRRYRGTIEASGGALKWVLGPWAVAITLGHVILAKDTRRLELWREHERHHVRQYECWGPLFLPVYILLAGWCLASGKHPYLDHPLELDAGLHRHHAESDRG